MKRKRVIAKEVYRSDYKTNEEWSERVQYLQEERSFLGFKYWKTIDMEIVPTNTLIHLACFGEIDSFESKFKYIPNVEFIKHK